VFPVVEESLRGGEALWCKAELRAHPDPAAQRPDDLQHVVAESPGATQNGHPLGASFTISRDAWPSKGSSQSRPINVEVIDD
jgi:hypothetical protein